MEIVSFLVAKAIAFTFMGFFGGVGFHLAGRLIIRK